MGVVTRFWDVPDPLLGLVSALLLYSQVSNSEATTGEHGHLELHGNRRFLPRLLVLRLGQVSDGRQNLLLITLKLFDSPEYSRFVRLVLAFATARRKHLDLWCIRRHRYLYHNVVCIISTLEYRANLNWVFNSSIVGVLLDHWSYFERQVYILTDSIGHDFEESIRRNEGDWTISVETSKSHALVELDVINLNTFLLFLCILRWRTCRLSQQKLIINSKFALGHTR